MKFIQILHGYGYIRHIKSTCFIMKVVKFGFNWRHSYKKML